MKTVFGHLKRLRSLFPISISQEKKTELSKRTIFFSLFCDDHELWITFKLRSFSLGLAWTAMGGEIMFVEATRMGGEGKITLTGQLGRLIASWLLCRISNDKKTKWSHAILGPKNAPETAVGLTSSPLTTSFTMNFS